MDSMEMLKDMKVEHVEPKNPECLEVKPDVKLLLEIIDNGVHNCSSCDQSFHTKIALLNHRRDHREIRSKFSCTECKTSYSSKINLKIHLSSKLHKPEKRYQCGHCQKKFSSQIYLKRHKLGHINTGSLFKCPECWRKFFRLSDFLIHQKRHKEKEFKCGVCYRNFISPSMLELHKCGIRFECYCKKTYATRKGLRLHQETHIVEKSHQCSICNKMFAVRRYLQAHMAFHRGILDAVVCDICFKKFPRKSGLRNHMKTHKTLQCDICSLPFNRLIDLRIHKKVHKKIHPCDVCGRSFPTLSYLKRHKVKHDKQPPVECGQCSAKFRFPSFLVRHVALKHGKRREYPCSQCTKTFQSTLDLALHAKVHQPAHLTFDDSPGLLGYFNYNVSLY